MVSQEGSNLSEHHLYLYLHVRYMYICMYVHVTVCCIIYMTHNEVLLYCIQCTEVSSFQGREGFHCIYRVYILIHLSYR